VRYDEGGGWAIVAEMAKRGSEHMRTTNALDELKGRVVPILRRHDVVRAGVFGSFARGEQTPTSDVDFLVAFDDTKRKTLFDLSALAIDLEDTLGREVDVVTYQSLNRRMREQVLSEEVPLL